MTKLKIIPALLILFFSVTGHAQKTTRPQAFRGAEATLTEYKALYILNQSDDKKIRGIIRNINNALADPRLKGKLQVELVAFGDGVEMYRKTAHYDTLLTALQNKGVILAQCENTVRERHISKEELWPFVSYVPSGNGEIIIRQYQGWAIVHP
ncbi:DsrE family protein [Flavisolibacter nicotianae]|uniref:DsrE family protein n=1 Tax=Flavisolibacter nicotianae TaxID=2364882 RepID=UPI000EB43864|nr:DsrE family protein [Flavisolibacter nicotianae]